MRIRGGSGLGDSLYVRPIAEHFVGAGHQVTVLSNYPDVFIGAGAVVEPFSRIGVNVLAHYVGGKGNATTTQWDDVCRSAGVAVPLRFGWTVRNPALVEGLVAKAAGRPIVVAHGGRTPMGRTDGFGMELLPVRTAFDAALGELDDCFVVAIGASAGALYRLPVHLDLNGSTTVSDLIDIASICDGIVAQCSFAVPLAEVFDKPLLAIWAARGLASSQPYIRTITPAKVLSKPSSAHAMDDWQKLRIREAARAFRQF